MTYLYVKNKETQEIELVHLVDYLINLDEYEEAEVEKIDELKDEFLGYDFCEENQSIEENQQQ